MSEAKTRSAALASAFKAVPSDEQKERATALSDAICAALPLAGAEQSGVAAAAIINSNASHKSKYAKCVTLVDNVMAAIIPHTPCKRGCSHCCNIAVIISMEEAKLISDKTGKKILARSGEKQGSLKHLSDKFRDCPCPFLVHGECSIYDVRPLVCRAHHTLNSDCSQCDLAIPSESSCVSSMAAPYAIHQAIALDAASRRIEHADIRDFFEK